MGSRWPDTPQPGCWPGDPYASQESDSPDPAHGAPVLQPPGGQTTTGRSRGCGAAVCAPAAASEGPAGDPVAGDGRRDASGVPGTPLPAAAAPPAPTGGRLKAGGGPSAAANRRCRRPAAPPHPGSSEPGPAPRREDMEPPVREWGE